MEIVRRAIRHINETGEPEWALCNSGLVWTTRADGPAHLTYNGLDGPRQGMASLGEVWAEVRGDVVEIAETGEAWLTWVRDGKITRIEQHGSKQEALEAAGLSE